MPDKTSRLAESGGEWTTNHYERTTNTRTRRLDMYRWRQVFCVIMQCTPRKRQYTHKKAGGLERAAQSCVNPPSWRIFGHKGSSISARYTGETMAPSGPEKHWNEQPGVSSMLATLASYEEEGSKSRVSEGSRRSPKLWVYLWKRGVEMTRMRVSGRNKSVVA